MHGIVRFPDRLLTRVSNPAAEPVSLSDAKAYLRVDTADDDALIGALIVAARQMAEEHIRRSFITQSWKLALDWLDSYSTAYTGWYFLGFEARAVPLPRGPVADITSVTAYDVQDSATVLTAGAYKLDAAKDALLFVDDPAASRVEIVYTAGYGAGGSSVPQPIVYGILAHVAALYDGRGEAEGIPAQAKTLYAPYREQLL